MLVSLSGLSCRKREREASHGMRSSESAREHARVSACFDDGVSQCAVDSARILVEIFLPLQEPRSRSVMCKTLHVVNWHQTRIKEGAVNELSGACERKLDVYMWPYGSNIIMSLNLRAWLFPEMSIQMVENAHIREEGLSMKGS